MKKILMLLMVVIMGVGVSNGQSHNYLGVNGGAMTIVDDGAFGDDFAGDIAIRYTHDFSKRMSLIAQTGCLFANGEAAFDLMVAPKVNFINRGVFGLEWYVGPMLTVAPKADDVCGFNVQTGFDFRFNLGRTTSLYLEPAYIHAFGGMWDANLVQLKIGVNININ